MTRFRPGKVDDSETMGLDLSLGMTGDKMSVSPVKAGAMNQKLGLWVPRRQQVG